MCGREGVGERERECVVERVWERGRERVGWIGWESEGEGECGRGR